MLNQQGKSSASLHQRIFVAWSTMTACPSAFAAGDSGSILLLIMIALGAAGWVFSSMVSATAEKAIEKRKAEIQEKENQERQLTARTAEEARVKIQQERAMAEAVLHRKRIDIDNARQAFEASYAQGREWLSEYIAEAFRAPDMACALALETKKHPAHKAAYEVRRIAQEKKELLQRVKKLVYTLKTYHEYYPVLEQYHDDILNEEATLVLDDDDPDIDLVSRYISKEEYEHLSTAERNQRALENWIARPKSNVEIGRMFERYLGSLYEEDCWHVSYIGAIEGIEDMGRDLICIKGNEVQVVQAKFWAKHRTIHEKHIFQLHGTSILLQMTRADLKGKEILPVFATTTKLSPTAQYAADALGVTVHDYEMDWDYPMIKCNVNGRDQIYHLPFDQQYDRVRIDPTRGECYVKTAAEAEELGFRRAMRHIAFST